MTMDHDATRLGVQDGAYWALIESLDPLTRPLACETIMAAISSGVEQAVSKYLAEHGLAQQEGQPDAG
jgi:hypothetical protein